MRVLARIEGVDPPEWLRSRSRLAARAITVGMDAAGKGAQQDLRAMVRSAGLGQRLGNAIRQSTYPRPPAYSPRAASEIVANRNAADIIRSFSEGATISAKGGKYLAIATDAIPRGRWGEKLTPRQAEARFLQKLELAVIGGRPCLVLPAARLTRGGRARGASSRQLARGRVRAVVAFWLVPQVTLAQRLAPRPIAAAWARRLPGIIDRAAAGLRG